MILFQTAKGDPTIRVVASLCVTSHAAAKLHFSVAALSSGFSALVVAVGYILLIDVPATGFHLFQQTAFQMFPISEQSFVTHIVAEYGQDKGTFPILAEQPVTLLQIPYQQFFRFRLRHIIGQFLSRKFTMSVTVVRIIRTVMDSLVFLNHSTANSAFALSWNEAGCPNRTSILRRQAGGKSNRQHRRCKQPFITPFTDRHLLSPYSAYRSRTEPLPHPNRC